MDASLAVVDLRAGTRWDSLIGEPSPTLSWRVDSNVRDVRLSGYRLQVAEDEGFERLLSDTGDVRSPECLYRPWPGPPLASRQVVYWRVRAETNHGWTPWSGAARLEAGLLDPNEWQARFITSKTWDNDKREAGPAPMFRRTFEVDAPVVSARLYITALGFFEAWLNGGRVGQDVLAPDWVSYGHRIPYYTYDVTDLVRRGSNTIGAVLGNGWYRGWFGIPARRCIYGDRLALLAQLEITTSNGDRLVVGTDESWTSATGALQYDDLYNGCLVDLRSEQDGWTSETFRTPWSSVEELEGDHRSRLYCNDAPPVRTTEVRRISSRWGTPWGTTILDLGQNCVGWLRLSINGGASGDKVEIRHAEVLDADGRLLTRVLGVARATDTYVLDGRAATTLEPKFTFHGFRYAEVTAPVDVVVDEAEAVVFHSAMDRTGDFSCSDLRVNRLFENIVWSQRGNFLSIPTDCPSRSERLGWTGDVQVFADTGAFIYDCRDFLGRWLDDLALEQHADGAVPMVVPNAFEPPSGGGWGDAATVVPWALYVAYGDAPRLRRSYASMKRWVDYCAGRLDPDGVRVPMGEALTLSDPELMQKGIEFGDWVDPSAGGHPLDARADRYFLASAYVARSAALVVKAARVLGEAGDAETYGALSARVAAATWDRWGDHVTESQTGCAVSLTFDIAPVSERERVARTLAELVEAEGYKIGSGFLGTPLVLPALTEHGYAEHAHRMLLEEECPSWLHQVRQGATTIWERWDAIGPDGSIREGGDASDLPEMLSFNHYAFGSIGAWLVRSVAGLAPDEKEPGYRHVLIAPQPGAIGSARATHRSPYGPIMVHWRNRTEDFRLEVSLPPGTSAAVSLPRGIEGDVTVDGGEPQSAPGVLGFDDSSPATLRLGSGAYVIRAQRRFSSASRTDST